MDELSASVQFDCEREDRVPLLTLMTEYLAITYKHCESLQQQHECENECAPAVDCEHAASSGDTQQHAAGSSSRRVLTKKAEPAGNDGYDNDDRNLIVRVRDIIGGNDSRATAAHSTSKCNKHAVATATSTTDTSARYIVLDLLGQGTFGQVFRCQHVSTKQIVAVKVIRNHPSYYKQAIVEVQITRMLNRTYSADAAPHIVRLLDSFEFRNHLCLVFELLSMNVYELITENNFNGFPLEVTRGFLEQLLRALMQLADAGVIHCDLKPENILLAGPDRLYDASTHISDSRGSAFAVPVLKIVDFGSACRENETVYSYIQSRFYRSPEVLLGIPYSGAIDMWSLGCIAFEMLLGLPLFPGVSEHDQLRLIEETLGELPQHLLRRGRNVLKFYDVCARPTASCTSSFTNAFVLKSPAQYAHETQSDVKSAKKYFKYTKLDDLVFAYPFRADATASERSIEIERRHAFLDLLGGLLIADPTARWTAREALQHPFITGERFVRAATPRYVVPAELHDSMMQFQQLQHQQRALDAALYYQPHVEPNSYYGLDCTGFQHMTPLVSTQQMHSRVCPVDPLYADASAAYYSEQLASAYAHDQPWTSQYAPPPLLRTMDSRSVAFGSSGYYTYEPPQPTIYECASQQEPPQMGWPAPPYEPFDPPPLPRQCMTQKVAPVPPTRHVVMPVHSPPFDSQQRCAYAYDPSFMLPQSHQQPVHVVPMSESFQTPTKPQPSHHHHNSQQQYGNSNSGSHVGLEDARHKSAAPGRGARRRRPTQPRIPDTGLPLPSFGPETTSSISDCSVRSNASVALASAGGQQQQMQQPQHRSKRRSDSDSDAGEHRLYKSPRRSNVTAESKLARTSHTLPDDGGVDDKIDDRTHEDARWQHPTANAAHSTELYCAEPTYVCAPPAPPLPT